MSLVRWFWIIKQTLLDDDFGWLSSFFCFLLQLTDSVLDADLLIPIFFQFLILSCSLLVLLLQMLIKIVEERLVRQTLLLLFELFVSDRRKLVEGRPHWLGSGFWRNFQFNGSLRGFWCWNKQIHLRVVGSLLWARNLFQRRTACRCSEARLFLMRDNAVSWNQRRWRLIKIALLLN